MSFFRSEIDLKKNFLDPFENEEEVVIYIETSNKFLKSGSINSLELLQEITEEENGFPELTCVEEQKEISHIHIKFYEEEKNEYEYLGELYFPAKTKYQKLIEILKSNKKLLPQHSITISLDPKFKKQIFSPIENSLITLKDGDLIFFKVKEFSIEQYQMDMEILSSKNIKLELDNEDLQQNFNEISKEKNDLSSQVLLLRNRMETLEKRISTLTIDKTQVENQNKVLSEQNKKFEEQNSVLKKSVSLHNSRLTELNKQIELVELQNQNASKDFRLLNEQNKNFLLDNIKLKDQNKILLLNIKSLDQENKKLLESVEKLAQEKKLSEEESAFKNECNICMENQSDTALVPCGHLVCSNCSVIVDKCPFCNKNFEKTIKIFF